LERQYNDLRARAQQIYDEAQKRQKLLAATSPGGQAKKDKPPINPNRLGELVDTIAKADLSGVMRRQTICALLREQPPQPLFRELFISIQDLGDLILPNFNITANRWLFQYLTETLDRRMLALLARNDDPEIAVSFSINLNVSTLLSPEFLAFDAGLKQGARGSILIELQIIDIYADLAAFLFARDFLQGRGYRICLDGLTERTLQYVDRRELGVDFIKIQWSPAMGENASPESRKRLQEMIDKAGRISAILCRVDSEEAVNFGKSLGIAMFQGRYIEQIVQMTRRGIK
jgi:EAL domain-containing protein (putative c-di-GMP-specific phosphodiesterase class I)